MKMTKQDLIYEVRDYFNITLGFRNTTASAVPVMIHPITSDIKSLPSLHSISVAIRDCDGRNSRYWCYRIL